MPGAPANDLMAKLARRRQMNENPNAFSKQTPDPPPPSSTSAAEESSQVEESESSVSMKKPVGSFKKPVASFKKQTPFNKPAAQSSHSQSEESESKESSQVDESESSVSMKKPAGSFKRPVASFKKTTRFNKPAAEESESKESSQVEESESSVSIKKPSAKENTPPSPKVPKATAVSESEPDSPSISNPWKKKAFAGRKQRKIVAPSLDMSHSDNSASDDLKAAMNRRLRKNGEAGGSEGDDTSLNTSRNLDVTIKEIPPKSPPAAPKSPVVVTPPTPPPPASPKIPMVKDEEETDEPEEENVEESSTNDEPEEEEEKESPSNNEPEDEDDEEEEEEESNAVNVEKENVATSSVEPVSSEVKHNAGDENVEDEEDEVDGDEDDDEEDDDEEEEEDDDDEEEDDEEEKHDEIEGNNLEENKENTYLNKNVDDEEDDEEEEEDDDGEEDEDEEEDDEEEGDDDEEEESGSEEVAENFTLEKVPVAVEEEEIIEEGSESVAEEEILEDGEESDSEEEGEEGDEEEGESGEEDESESGEEDESESGEEGESESGEEEEELVIEKGVVVEEEVVEGDSDGEETESGEEETESGDEEEMPEAVGGHLPTIRELPAEEATTPKDQNNNQRSLQNSNSKITPEGLNGDEAANEVPKTAENAEPVAAPKIPPIEYCPTDEWNHDFEEFHANTFDTAEASGEESSGVPQQEEIPSEPDLESGTLSKPSESPKPVVYVEKEYDGISKKWLWCLLITGLILLIGTCAYIGTYISTRNKEEKEAIKDTEDSSARDIVIQTAAPVIQTVPPTESQVADVDSTSSDPNYRLLCSVVLDCEALLNNETAQGKSFEWLKNTTFNPELEFYSTDKKIQRFTLATFFYSTGGDLWEDNTNWLTEVDECEWFTSSSGSPCEDGVDFTVLELRNNNVQGELPNEIGLLTSLKSLVLRSPPNTPPFIAGTLPASLGTLTNLEQVQISGHAFAGGIPQEIRNWQNIQSLDLSNNGLEGKLDLTLSYLTSLTLLNLKGNKMAGSMTSDFTSKLTNLVDLYLDDNLLTGVPPSIDGLISLRTLRMTANKFERFPFEALSLLNLELLDLGKNGFGGPIPTILGRMTALKALYLNDNGLTGNIPMQIGNMVRLEEGLDLSFNELMGPIPSQIGQLRRLERLWLNNNNLNGWLPSELQNLEGIAEIHLDNNNFSGPIPTEICNLFDQTNPASYADCEELGETSSCFKFCCVEGEGCRCRYEDTDPLLCLN